MDAELRYDDNILLSEADELDSTILEAAPFIQGTIYKDGNTYQAKYQLTHAEYFDSSEDTYTDHEFSVDINHRFTTRQAIAASVEHSLLTELRGRGFSELGGFIIDDPDDYDQTLYDLTYFLGATSADLRFELNANRTELNYDSSFVGDTRDYSADELGVLMRYRVGAKTDLLLEYRNLDVNYDNQPISELGVPIDLDSDEDYYLIGLAWDVTAKTTGEVKVGQSQRDYDSNDFSDFHWEAELTWRPQTYSEFILNTKRESLETYTNGRYINVESYNLTWNHGWTSRLGSRIEAAIIDDTYEDSDRADDRFFWKAEMNYDYRNWLGLGVGVEYAENDSNFELVEYDRTVYFIKASIEL